jgi:hypothetical protein
MMAARKEAEPAMNKDEDYICFYRDAVIAGHDAPAAETMRRFNLTYFLACSAVRVLRPALG